MTNTDLIFIHEKPNTHRGTALKSPAVELFAATARYLDCSTIAEGLYFTILHYIATE